MVSQHNKQRVNWTIVLTVVGLVSSWAWGAAVGAWQFNDRVTKLETHREHDARALERIFQKLDRIAEVLERRP